MLRDIVEHGHIQRYTKYILCIYTYLFDYFERFILFKITVDALRCFSYKNDKNYVIRAKRKYEGHPKINESCWISCEPWHVAYWNFSYLLHSPIHTFDTKINATGWRRKVWRHYDWRHILDSVRGDTP